MEERYSRNLGALTEAECQRLRTKRVCVVGCGGLGGSNINMLLRVGVGAITAVDGDVFEESNLNRQLLSDENVIGRKKAVVAAEFAQRVNSGVEFKAVDAFLTETNSRDLITGHDVVIDALDSIASRRILALACNELGIPMIYGAIRSWYAQVTVLMPGDDVIDKLYSPETRLTDKASLAFTPPFCATLQVAECIKLLCGRPVSLHGKLLCVDLLTHESVEISLQ